MKTKTELIKDGQSLVSAKSRFGINIQVYDDGVGPLWIHRDSMGISGIVRAQTFETAYEICEDEFFPEAEETIEELQKEYGFKREHVRTVVGKQDARYPDVTPYVRWDTIDTPNPDAWSENELFQEAYGFRPNGSNEKDKHKHGIYAKDLNGDYLDLLTNKLITELEITLEIRDEEE